MALLASIEGGFIAAVSLRVQDAEVVAAAPVVRGTFADDAPGEAVRRAPAVLRAASAAESVTPPADRAR